MSIPQNVAILGGGEAGVASALLAKWHGSEVFLSDHGEIQAHYRSELQANNIPFEENGHDLERLCKANVVIKSPGIPQDAAVVLALREQHLPIWSDIELAYRSKPEGSQLVAITGSNGKTTVTTWLGHILEKSGASVRVGGNIGTGAGRLMMESSVDIYVLEVSSVQLEDCPSFRPDIAIITNITPDHMDRHGSMEAYVDAKFQVTKHQMASDAFLYDAQDPLILSELQRVKATTYPIYRNEPRPIPAVGAYPLGDSYRIQTSDNDIMTIEQLALQGKHNTSNALAAGLSARLLQVRNDMVRETLAHFDNLAHRMESVGHIHGIHFINDSKATNVNATYYAIESMKAPTVWIVGGVDKGNDYSELFKLVERHVKGIVAIGSDLKAIRTAFAERVPFFSEADNMADAVKYAYQLAEKGDNVLLSPCCASFDLFTSYEDRGNQFKLQVRQL